MDFTARGFVAALEERGDWLDTRQNYLKNMPEEKYLKPAFFIYNDERRPRPQDFYEEKHPEYAVVSYWDNAEQKRKIGDLPQKREVVARFFPEDNYFEMPDFLNKPVGIMHHLLRLRALGPYVEIYKFSY